jgi:hypothetical protein
VTVLVGREVPVWRTDQPQTFPDDRTAGAPAGPNDMNVQTLLKQQQ